MLELVSKTPRVVLEGITIQCAAELIYDTADTRASRIHSPNTYLRSLDDFFLNVLTVGRIAVSGSLPSVGSERPGAALLAEFPDLVTDVDLVVPFEPSQILTLPAERRRLQRYLSCFSTLWKTQRDRRFWTEHIAREIHVYFGDDPTTTVRQSDPTAYQFAWRPTYKGDTELEAHLPKAMLEDLGESARILKPRAHRDAINSFVVRNLVVHIMVMVWYESARAPYLTVRSPHATRATLLNATRNQEFRSALHRVLLPHVLTSIMRASRDRHELVDRLKDRFHEPAFETLRQRLATAYIELENGNTTGAEKLLKDVAAVAATLSDALTSVKLAAKVFARADGSLGIEPSVEVAQRSPASSSPLGLLFHQGGQLSWNDYNREASRLFPELFAT